MSAIDYEQQVLIAVEVVKVYGQRVGGLVSDENRAYKAALEVLAVYLGAPPPPKSPAAGPDPKSTATLRA